MAIVMEDKSSYQASSHLRWLLPELQASLIQAESSLDSFSVSSDAEELQEYTAALSACDGAATIAQLPLFAAVCSDLLKCGQALANGASNRQKMLCNSANQALQQIPVLLQQQLSDGVQSTAPWVLIINELRAALSLPLLSHLAFAEGWQSQLSAKQVPRPIASAEIEKLGKVYQHALQKLFQGEDVAKHLAYLHKVCERLSQSSGEPLWLLANSCLTAIRTRKIKLGRALRDVLRSLNSELNTHARAESSALLASCAFYTLAADAELWPDSVNQPSLSLATQNIAVNDAVLTLVQNLNIDELATAARQIRQELTSVRTELSEALENGWHKDAIQNCPENLTHAAQLLTDIGGAQLAQIVDQAKLFIDQAMLQADMVPSWSRIDALIDVLVGIDYFAEHASKRICPIQLNGLTLALNGVSRLGNQPNAIDEGAANGQTIDQPSSEEQAVDLSLLPAAPIASDNLAELADDFDADILDIFLDEAEELIQTIADNFSRWQQDNSDNNALAELKRHTHTLKGGARMSGLAPFGEYAHALEGWLEEVLERIERNENQKQDETAKAFALQFEQAQDRLALAIERIRNPASAQPQTQLQNSATQNSSAGGEPTKATPTVTIEAIDEQTERDSAPEATDALRVSTKLLDELVQLSWDGSSALAESEVASGELRQRLSELQNYLDRLQSLVEESDNNRYRELAADFSLNITKLEQVTEQMEYQQGRQRALNNQLQTGLLRTRTVQVSKLLPRLRRTVRSLANELGKNVDFKVYTASVELDKRVLDKLVPAFEHLLRNAIDHGLESPEARSAAGKSEQGCITMRFSREAGDVVITLNDDGAGINLEKVRSKALAAGLLTPDEEATTQQLLDVIFQPGFSTADTLSQVSGRGVGMDAVRAEIRSLGGTVTAETGIVKMEGGERAYEPGGTQFTIRVPFTMAGNKALLVEAMGELWAVPYQAVDGVIQLNTWELQEYYNDPTAKLESGGQHYNLCYLPSLLGGETSPNFDVGIESGEKTVLLIHGVQPPCALHVDKLIANRELLVKPVGKLLDNIPGLQGSSVLGNGDIALVLNIPALLDSETPVQKLQSSETLEGPTKESDKPKLALVIDDSATARSLATRLLEGQGYTVVCAVHGQEALDKLQAMAELPSLILLDIDMPVMDGYTFAEKMTKNAVFASIPVIVASSREGEEHQQRLADLRTQGALVKPYDAAELEQALQQLEQIIIYK